jgi:hypothetical protein
LHWSWLCFRSSSVEPTNLHANRARRCAMRTVASYCANRRRSNMQHTACNMQRGAVRTRIRSNGCSTHSRTAVGWSDLQSPLRLGRCRTVSLRQHSLRCTAKDRSGLFLLALGSAGAQPAVAAVRLRCKLGVQEENEQHNQVQPCTTRAPRRTSARLGAARRGLAVRHWPNLTAERSCC